ncbi:MAG TPA: hypothetical protein VFN55_15815 [Solirubrobacteraceae bacterium]|nr:hypothetical protein [Solirubrobacteraceae bacterium]
MSWALLVCVIAGAGAAPASARSRPVYRSPGYHWNHKLPTVAPVVPGRLLKLGDGVYPRVLVDAAGTGQIAWTTQPSDSESALHDCALMRGQTTCSGNSSLLPPTTGDPRYSIDEAGPQPLAIGNELLMITHRFPNVADLPDGSTGYPTFLYTSEDGGRSFTGPGTIGQLDLSGNAVVFGGDQPQIGVITDTTTGGTLFQATPPGAFTSQRLNLGDQGPDEAYNGRLAVDGTNPVAAFTDLSNHIFIREYSGSGDIYDSGNWSVQEMDGQGYTRIVSGPSGVWLLFQKTFSGPLFLQRIVHGIPTGAPNQVTPNSDFNHAYYAITEDASGRVTVGYFVNSAQLVIRSSPDGRHWAAPQVIATHLNDPTQLSLGAAPDGGGFAAFNEPEPGGVSHYQVAVAAFGSFVATGQKGLGNLDGAGIGGLGGDPLASTSCTDVHFAALDALAEAGCWLRDPRHPTSGAAVIQGQVRLNGMELIPDAGVQIVIDPRQHTINSTGSVRVVLRAPLVGDITLFYGTLNISLQGARADVGGTFADWGTATASTLKGFPFSGGIDVQLTKDGVRIPVSLELPSYMGGVTGQATLIADNATGLHLDSLHIGVDDLVLGAMEIKNLNIDYASNGNVWSGSAHLNIPAGTPYFGIDVAVRFDDGDFTMGSFNVSVPYPGVPIFADTYLDGFGGGFDIHPDRRSFHGSVTVGAIPLDPPNYTVGVTGTVTVTFIDNGPVVLEVDGAGSVHGLQIATAKLIFQTNGYFEADGNLNVDLDVVALQASLKAFADLPAKTFSAELNGSISGSISPFGSFSIGVDGIISSKGFAACGSAFGGQLGFAYPWGDTPSLSFGCDVAQFRVTPTSIAAVAGRHRPARIARVPMASGAPFVDLAVAGAGAPPSVILHGPGGRTVTPVAVGPGHDASPSDAAIALLNTRDNTTDVQVRRPGGGTWTVSPAPGSSAITQVRTARGYDPVTVRGRLGGRGASRRLRYSVHGLHAGATVTFAEVGRREYKVLGTAHGRRGTLRFSPGDGPTGTRRLQAIVSLDGIPRTTTVLARYRYAGPLTPGRVHGLRVRHHGRRFAIGFGRGTGAAYYVLTVHAADGRRLVRVIRRGRHGLTVSALGYHDRVQATVVGVSTLGRHGRTSSAHS